MVDPMSPDAIIREFERNNKDHESFVTSREFNLILAEFRNDFTDIKDWQRRMTWAIIGGFGTLIVVILGYLLSVAA